MTVFFDTNILVYAFSSAPRSGKAQAIMSTGGLISVQVVNEFSNVLRKKLKQDWHLIEAATEVLRNRFPRVLPLTIETTLSATRLARDHSLGFYDALIVASALEAECDMLFSEDIQHGRKFGKLTIDNPFMQPPIASALAPYPSAPSPRG